MEYFFESTKHDAKNWANNVKSISILFVQNDLCTYCRIAKKNKCYNSKN